MKVLIIDDDRLVTMALKTILEAEEIAVAGVGHNGLQAIEMYDRLRPDVLLMDIRMELKTGLDAAREILAQHPEARILFLTTFSDDEYIVRALQIGAKGYILKQNFDSIAPSVKTVFAGQRVYGDEIVDRLPELMGDAGKPEIRLPELSEKEREVMKQVANGLSNREIAEALYLGEGTVRNYISTILEKLALRDRTQLAIFYYKNRVDA